MNIPALTIWQPWASLLACGAKLYETRSWATNYRGPIAIHAAALDPMIATRDLPGYVHDAMGKAFEAHGYTRETIDYGCIIATAELVGCHRIESFESTPGADDMSIRTPDGFARLNRYEVIFGDFTPGRYAWEFANMKMLDEPIPAKGRQGLWRWEGA